MYEIQFIRRSNLSLPGMGAVSAFGAILSIGDGGACEGFIYRNPEEQARHYGQQEYVLVAEYDKRSRLVDNPDTGRRLDGGGFIPSTEVDDFPAGAHRMLRRELGLGEDPVSRAETAVALQVAADEDDEEEDAEEEKQEEQEEVLEKKPVRRRSSSSKSRATSTTRGKSRREK
jgi:hypothetical protein